ncbi:SDR family oxidoreductase [Curvibacter sp. CHRR-16]|uniref:SDR family NAD(P)-dependent oxidoreductase n=1 Tax=Curvibacter sp. CHRR-16 TaxID=2835872 RepID=UPI001BD9CACE|nr:SDR family oxidoreductase [Curvibacter sp. CHRR-16]MBT0570069.1 SDR family oxidoreductase [Curvibacter sp. CHRR-16]
MNIHANLNGKCALVTGGASGIGLATVEALAQCGATVAVNDLPGSAALAREEKRLQEAGFNVFAVGADMGNSDDIATMVDTVVARTGKLDYLINNAATPGTRTAIPASDLESQTDAFWYKLLSVNLLGPFNCIKSALPHLKASKGAVVNVASTAAFGGGGSSTAYAAGKSALVLMTRELAKGLGPDVRVNGVAPGWVGQSGWDCAWEAEEANAAAIALPLQRIGLPVDYAQVIFFLCAGADYMTGQTLVVDGGLLA